MFLWLFFFKLIDYNNEWGPEISWSGGSRPLLDLKSWLASNPLHYFSLHWYNTQKTSGILFRALPSPDLPLDAGAGRSWCLVLARSCFMNCWLIYCSVVRWRANPSGAVARSTTQFLGQVKAAPSSRIDPTYGCFYFIFKSDPLMKEWRRILGPHHPGMEVSRLHPTTRLPGSLKGFSLLPKHLAMSSFQREVFRAN